MNLWRILQIPTTRYQETLDISPRPRNRHPLSPAVASSRAAFFSGGVRYQKPMLGLESPGRSTPRLLPGPCGRDKAEENHVRSSCSAHTECPHVYIPYTHVHQSPDTAMHSHTHAHRFTCECSPTLNPCVPVHVHTITAHTITL